MPSLAVIPLEAVIREIQYANFQLVKIGNAKNREVFLDANLDCCIEGIGGATSLTSIA